MCSHFADVKTGVQRVGDTCSGSHHKEMKELRLDISVPKFFSFNREGQVPPQSHTAEAMAKLAFEPRRASS